MDSAKATNTLRRLLSHAYLNGHVYSEHDYNEALAALQTLVEAINGK